MDAGDETQCKFCNKFCTKCTFRHSYGYLAILGVGTVKEVPDTWDGSSEDESSDEDDSA